MLVEEMFIPYTDWTILRNGFIQSFWDQEIPVQ